MADLSPRGIFDECIICIVPSKELPDRNVVELYETLRENGAETKPMTRSGTFDIEDVTHIISTHVDFPEYEKATNLMISVIKPSWVAQSLLKNRQAPLRPHTPDPRLIFSGINITTADIPRGDKDAIIGAVLAMGGQETSSLSKLNTHIVALTMDHEKVRQALDKRVKCKVVLPHWFDDCLKLGKRIDERPYTLPNPEILYKSAEDDLMIPNSQHIEGAVSARPDFLEQPTDSPTGTGRVLSVFSGKKIMLAEDLHLGTRLRAILGDLVVDGGGQITAAVSKADILVCHYREGEDYVSASRSGKDVGNLSWLYHLITNNQWTSPFRRLMHYPIPKDGIPGFKDFRITLSNYGGEARIYLENLVIAAGGEFTKSMKQDNTHLITARKASEKCMAAQEWNINMVNHLWIEESYAKCTIQSLTNPRYTHFPPRTNLGEVIGQTQFDKEALEELYFPEDITETHEKTKTSRNAMQQKDGNVAAMKPTTTEAPPAAAAEESLLPKQKATPTPSRAAPRIGTPLTSRIAGGKENETPSSTSSRGAKDRALSRLHDLAPDVALYEKEKKRAGGGVWGGKRAADQAEREREASKKRSSSPDEDEDDVATEDGHESKRQKIQKQPLPAAEMRLLITSFSRWLDKPSQEDIERRKLRTLGILVVQDPHTCTHLAAPSIIRTQKFLTALASGTVLLSTAFIEKCLESDTLPSPEKFLLKDPQNEKKWGLKLKDVLTRAKSNKKKLLAGVVVYCTAEIPNGTETYKAIVEANGGIFSVFRGRGGTMIRPSKEGEEDETDGEPVYLLSGIKPDEKRVWPKFEQMVVDGKMEPRIVSTEWILNTAMMQQNTWKESYLLPGR